MSNSEANASPNDRRSRSRSYSRSTSRSYSRSRSRSNSYDRSRSPYPSRSRSISRSSRSDSHHSPHEHQPKDEFWDNKVCIVGEKVKNITFHFCFDCEQPILTYGRMLPCKHVLCLTCAQSSPEKCFICNDPVQEIKQCVVGNIFMCNETNNCQRTYISKHDLNAHIDLRHRAKTVLKAPSENSFKPLTSNKNLKPIETLNSNLFKKNESNKIPTYNPNDLRNPMKYFPNQQVPKQLMNVPPNLMTPPQMHMLQIPNSFPNRLPIFQAPPNNSIFDHQNRNLNLPLGNMPNTNWKS